MKPDHKLGEPIPLHIDDPEPFFIIGMNGSGTSMLADCLGRHPDLYIDRREARLIPYLIKKSADIGDLSVDKNFLKLWIYVISIPMFQRINNGRRPPLPKNWRQFPRKFSAVLDAIFRYFAALEGKNPLGRKVTAKCATP